MAAVGVNGSSPSEEPTVDEGFDEPCRLWVDQQGKILDCCEAVPAMFGYSRHELIGQHVSLLLTDLADTELLRAEAVNPRLAFRSRCSIPFRAIGRNGHVSDCVLFMRAVKLPAGCALSIILRRQHADSRN